MTLDKHVRAVAGQPAVVWGEAFDHELRRLAWPDGLSEELTFCWSAVTEEQAAILQAVGYPRSGLPRDVRGRAGSAEGPRRTASWRGRGSAQRARSPRRSIRWRGNGWTWRSTIRPPRWGWRHWCGSCPSMPAIRTMRGLAIGWMPLPMRRWRRRHVGMRPAGVRLNTLLLGAEVPLLLAVAASVPFKTAAQVANRAMDVLAEVLEVGQEDTTAWLLHGGTFLRAGLASVLRCRILADRLGCRPWFPPQRTGLARLLVEVARWGRHDGTQLLGARCKPARGRRVWEALIDYARPSSTLRAALAASGIVTPAKRSAKRVTGLQTGKLESPCWYGEPVRAAVLRTDWTRKSGRVAIDFEGPNLRIEAAGPKGDLVLSGVWPCRASRDGQQLAQPAEWSEVCWFTDDDVAYLEVEAHPTPSVRVQRQIMLMREERLLFLAEALLGDQRAEWGVHWQLPLAEGVRWLGAEKTTEGRLRTGHGDALVLPLFLPEWQRAVQRASLGEPLMQRGDHLTGGLQRHALRVYAPLVISLQGRHARRPITWRWLTVGRDLKIVAPDEAVAYRMQIGKEQWVFYRSLDQVARRTALGMHTLSEFLAGRFFADDGAVDPIVEVEPASGP
ncbi:MAG: hypothetical protein KatS3mg111_2670 [Pirellulaceae bacterium]|nr:MAG: hypothetical protein KatS3mg111_2670 [Pirellulaceae bacterium]